MYKMKPKAFFSLMLIVVMLAAAGFSEIAFASISSPPLISSNFDSYRNVWAFAFQNPKYVSGVGTNILKIGELTEKGELVLNEEPICYNLIENDYHKTHRDELLEKAYLEFEENYENWRDRDLTILDNPLNPPEFYTAYKRLYSVDGTFKAWANDYTNPEKTVYLEVMLTEAAAAAEIIADEAVSLVYDTEVCPCIVVRFNGNEDVFGRIINNRNVLFVAPAFGERIEPSYVYREMRSPYNKTGITANSARNILRYAVGLDVSDDLEPDYDGYVVKEKEFFTFSDLDFDGHVTASDARIALRIAVGLEHKPVVDVDI